MELSTETERFNVVIQNGLQPGITPQFAQSQLAKARFPEAAIKTILLAKKSIVVKKDISLEDARKLQSVFQQCGLKASLDLQLNLKCLELGLIKTNSAESSKPAKALTFLIDETLIRPSLFGVGKSDALACDNPQQKVSINKLTYTWNSTLLIASTLIIAYYCEFYLINFFSANFGLRTWSTIIGITCLIAIIFSLPKLVQPLLCIELKVDKSEDLLLREDSSFHPIKKNYSVFDTSLLPKAFIHRAKNEAALYSGDGDCLYNWIKDSPLYELDDEEAEEIQKDFVTDHFGDWFENYLNLVKISLKIFRKKVNVNTLDLNASDGMPIFDQDNKIVALVFAEPHVAVKIYPKRLTEEQYPLLLCFALSILRPHYG